MLLGIVRHRPFFCARLLYILLRRIIRNLNSPHIHLACDNIGNQAGTVFTKKIDLVFKIW